MWIDYVNGTDYGVYNTSGACLSCKTRCKHDSKCGGVECGDEYCSWWKIGICGTAEKQNVESTGHTTCMKYDEGSDLLWWKYQILILYNKMAVLD